MLRTVGPGGVTLEALAGRPAVGTEGLSLFHLTWPADAPTGSYELFLAQGEHAGRLGAVPVER